MYCGDEVSAIVGDVGAAYSKFGYAGEELPKGVTESAVGVSDAPENAKGKRYHVGSSAIFHRKDDMELKSPLTHGFVTDWDVMESLWRYAFDTQLHVNPKEHPILAAVPSYASTLETQRKYCEMFFETFGTPALFLAKGPVLSAFSVGRATALVTECGAGMTSVVPVNDGYVLNKATQKSNLGGQALDAYLEQLLQPKNIKVPPRYTVAKEVSREGKVKVTRKEFPKTRDSYAKYMKLEVLRDMKEVASLTAERTLDPTLASQVPPTSYELPDGTTVDLGLERYQVPEALFDPSPLKETSYKPLQQMVYDSIHACDPDLRKEMANQILLTGGGSLFSSLQERLHKEMTELIPQSHRVRIITGGPIERKFSVWIGGSILASLGSFQQLWASKSEWEEHGSSIIQQRFP